MSVARAGVCEMGGFECSGVLRPAPWPSSGSARCVAGWGEVLEVAAGRSLQMNLVVSLLHPGGASDRPVFALSSGAMKSLCSQVQGLGKSPAPLQRDCKMHMRAHSLSQRALQMAILGWRKLHVSPLSFCDHLLMNPWPCRSAALFFSCGEMGLMLFWEILIRNVVVARVGKDFYLFYSQTSC